MRGIAAMTGLLLAAGVAWAQPGPQDMPPGPPPAPTPPPAEMNAPPAGQAPAPEGPQGGAPGRMSAKDRFAAANVTHDGRLTREQAQTAGWRMVTNHFAEIDRDRKGYVTMQDLRDWRQARRAARQAGAAGAPPAGAPQQGAPPEGGPPAGAPSQGGPPPY